MRSAADHLYPLTDLPDLTSVLTSVEWDVLCVLETCRWDVFQDMCTGASPVAAPGPSRFTWLSELAGHDAVTPESYRYITGVLDVQETANQDASVKAAVDCFKTDHVDELSDEHIRMVTPGDVLTRFTTRSSDTPAILHFAQPAPPFIGAVWFHINQPYIERSDGSHIELNDDAETYEYAAVQEGLVERRFVERAYEENASLVWERLEDLRDSDDRVLTIGTPGPVFATETCGDIVPDAIQSRTVPVHANWDVEFPEPETVGGSKTYTWEQTVEQDERTAIEDDDTDVALNESEISDDRKEQLRSLGYL